MPELGVGGAGSGDVEHGDAAEVIERPLAGEVLEARGERIVQPPFLLDIAHDSIEADELGGVAFRGRHRPRVALRCCAFIALSAA